MSESNSSLPNVPPQDFEEILEIVMSHTALNRSIDDDTLDLLAADVAGALATILGDADYKELEKSVVSFFAHELSCSGYYPWRDMRRRHGLHELDRIIFVLGVTNDEGLAELFNVTPAEIAKWRTGVMPEPSRLRVDRVFEIARDLQKIFRETRLWEIVQEPLPALSGASIMEAIRAERETEVIETLKRFATFSPMPS